MKYTSCFLTSGVWMFRASKMGKQWSGYIYEVENNGVALLLGLQRGGTFPVNLGNFQKIPRRFPKNLETFQNIWNVFNINWTFSTFLQP